MEPITDLPAIRRVLQVSQADLAFFLGMNRSMYSRVELDHRNLSEAATLRAGYLLQILNNEPDPPPAPEPADPRKVQLLKKMLDKYRRSLELLEARDAEDLALRESQTQIAKVLTHFDRLELPEFNPETGRIFRELLELKLPGPNDAESTWQKSVERRLEKEALIQKIRSLEEEIG